MARLESYAALNEGFVTADEQYESEYTQKASRRRRFRLMTLPKWIFAVAAVLVIARAALPLFLERYINKTLDSIPGYYGSVADVDVALWRGSYQIENVRLLKTKGDAKEPFFSADEIDIALDWRSLFRGRLVSKIALEEPKLQFVQRESKAASQTSIDESWQDQIKKLYPFEINHFAINDGLIRYRDETSSPKINLYISSLDLNADNISNTTKNKERLPSDLNLNAVFLKSGKIRLKSKLNALSEPMEVDINAKLSNLNLKEINDFAKEYGNFDFEKGELDASLELAASKSNYTGYLRTVMKDLEILGSGDKEEGDSIGHRLWEGLAGAITGIFKNHGRDQFAARIPVSGSREQIKFNSWETIGSVLRNTFVQALSSDLEESIDFSDATRSSTTEKEKK